jgi:fatty-acyl-CoA synthase
VAVIGVADERRGEVPAAFVVPAAGLDVDADDLRAFSRERLASFKVPGHVWLVEGLPLNSAGKVQKSELRAAAAARLQTL